jgi:hypothetical protein
MHDPGSVVRNLEGYADEDEDDEQNGGRKGQYPVLHEQAVADRGCLRRLAAAPVGGNL